MLGKTLPIRLVIDVSLIVGARRTAGAAAYAAQAGIQRIYYNGTPRRHKSRQGMVLSSLDEQGGFYKEGEDLDKTFVQSVAGLVISAMPAA
jgi:hypothetical protein